MKSFHRLIFLGFIIGWHTNIQLVHLHCYTIKRDDHYHVTSRPQDKQGFFKVISLFVLKIHWNDRFIRMLWSNLQDWILLLIDSIHQKVQINLKNLSRARCNVTTGYEDIIRGPRLREGCSQERTCRDDCGGGCGEVPGQWPIRRRRYALIVRMEKANVLESSLLQPCPLPLASKPSSWRAQNGG